MREGSRGQASIFVIIGIILLVAVSLTFFIRSESQPDDEFIDYTPEDLLPAEKYMRQCLEESAMEALLIVGAQGGYIDMPEYYDNPRYYIETIPGGFRTALWDLDGNKVVPDVAVLENEISKYIESNIPQCANEIVTIENVQDVSFLNTPSVITSINDDDVSFILEYHLETEFEKKRTRFEKYGLLIPLKLRKILDTAGYLSSFNTEHQLIAKTTMNLISLDPDIPTGDMRFSCEPKVWPLFEIEERLKEHLTYMIPRVRLAGSNYKPFDENIAVYQKFDDEWDVERIAEEGLPDPEDLPGDIYDYMQQFWETGGYDFSNLGISFSYEDKYGMILDASPRSGAVLNSKAGRSGSKYLKFLCMNIYHFTYDISYPVKVSIYDEDAFDGRGYLFNFGIPVYIEKNTPKTRPPVFAHMDALATDYDFCNTTSDEEIVIQVEDAATREMLSGVSVKYDCVRYYCDLGKTENLYGTPEVLVNLPAGCYNGFISANKPGYLSSKLQVVDQESHKVVELWPLKDFSYGVFNLGSDARLPDAQSAVINIRAPDKNFEAFYRYPSADGRNVMQLIDFPSEYELEIYLYYEDKFVGGWLGNWSVTEGDLGGSTIKFFPKEWTDLVRQSSTEKIVEVYTYLEEGTDDYRQRHYPLIQ